MAINKVSPVRCCGHLKYVLDIKQRKKVVRDCLKILEKHKNKFDAIAVSGYSMSLIGSIIAHKMNKGLIIVRKDEDKRASEFEVEGCMCDRYIIIDDLICTGDTICRVVNKISQEHCATSKLYGIYLYDSYYYSLGSNSYIAEQYNTLLLNPKIK